MSPQNWRQRVNTSIVVSNNTHTNSGANSIFAAGIDNGTFANNTLYRNHRQDPFGVGGGQFVVEAGNTNLELVGNTIRDAVLGSHACGIEFAPTPLNAEISGINIHGNLIHNNARVAVAFDEAEPTASPPKPYLPDDVRLLSNNLYSNSLEIGNNINVYLTTSPPLRDVNLDGNYYGAVPSTSANGSFGATPSSCVLATGASTCTIPVSWTSANASNVLIKVSGQTVANSGPSGSLNATEITSTGEAFEMWSPNVTKELIARHFVYGQ
jgi:hypothetical protein